MSQSHGSGDLQKRLWRLVSDFVRIRDFYTYPYCVATGVRIHNWRDGQAGHFKAYNSCNGMFKFDPMNIFLQSASSNAWGDQETGYQFGEELKRRFGQEYLQTINTENIKHSMEQTDNIAVVKAMEAMLEKIKDLPEHPDYFNRAYNLYILEKNQ